MQHRLHRRYVKLKARGKRENKAIVAIAREMAAFLWELQNKLNLPIPGNVPAIEGTAIRSRPHHHRGPETTDHNL